MTRYDAGKKSRFYISEDKKYNMPPCEMFVFGQSNSDQWHVVTKAEQFNADLIAYNFYGDETLYWVVLMANSIMDPFTDLAAGTNIRIPSKYVVDVMATM